MYPVTKLEQHIVLLRAGQPIDQVYFVDSGLVSLLAIAKDGRAVETGVVGGGGVVGADVILGTETAATQAIVALAGGARPMPTSQFLTLVESSPPLRDDVLWSLNSQLFQAQQNALCQGLHSIQARFCRWLLQASDALGADVLDLKQEFCGHILGVQRTSVSTNANTLQCAGVIRTGRGKIYLKDKAKLEVLACDCYARLKPYLDSIGRKGLQHGSQTESLATSEDAMINSHTNIRRMSGL